MIMALIKIKKKKADTSACSSSCCVKSTDKKILVEYLYLDLQTCDRCIGTDNVLDEVIMIITPALQLAGHNVEYKKIEMETAEFAERYSFISSPTIRVNGKDICASVKENSCGCCSEISGTDVDCRVFEFSGESYEVPPKEMLAEAVLKAVFEHADGGCSCGNYKLPQNLREFYEGKSKKSCCS
jgi:glutaredoxin